MGDSSFAPRKSRDRLSQLRKAMESTTVANLSALPTQEDESRMYCLKIPLQTNGPTRDEIKQLEMLYEKLTHAGIDPVWTRENVVHPSENDDNFYLLPAFRGHAFDRFKDTKARIVGVPIVSECLERRRPLPKRNHPVFSSHFANVLVTFTGFSTARKQSLRQLVLWMGGNVTPHLLAITTHVVAAKCDIQSAKYLESSRLKIPVLSEQWIMDAWETVSHSPFDTKAWTEPETVESYKLSIFTGFVFSISGVTGQDRTDFCRLVELNGGRITADMAKTVCTHLITDKTNTDKYKKAKQWGTVKPISTRWVRKCVNTGYLISERGYDPGDMREDSSAVREQEKERAAMEAAAATTTIANPAEKAPATSKASVVSTTATAAAADVKAKSAPSVEEKAQHSSGMAMTRRCSTPVVPGVDACAPAEWELSHISGSGGKVANQTNLTDSSLFNQSNASRQPRSSGQGLTSALSSKVAGGEGQTLRGVEQDAREQTVQEDATTLKEELPRNDKTKTMMMEGNATLITHRSNQSLRPASRKRRLDSADSAYLYPSSPQPLSDPSDGLLSTQLRGDFDFLEGHNILIAGIDPTKEDQWKQIINRLGATRVVQLDVATDLVVFRPTDKDQQLIKEAKRKNVQVAHAQWLIDCWKQKKYLLSADYDFSLDPATFQDAASAAAAGPSHSDFSHSDNRLTTPHKMFKITLPEGASQMINELSSQNISQRSLNESVSSVDIEKMLKIAVENTAKPEELSIRKVHSEASTSTRSSATSVRRSSRLSAGTAGPKVDTSSRVKTLRKTVGHRSHELAAEAERQKAQRQSMSSGTAEDAGGQSDDAIIEGEESQKTTERGQAESSQLSKEREEIRKQVDKMNKMLAMHSGAKISLEQTIGSLSVDVGSTTPEELSDVPASAASPAQDSVPLLRRSSRRRTGTLSRGSNPPADNLTSLRSPSVLNKSPSPLSNPSNPSASTVVNATISNPSSPSLGPSGKTSAPTAGGPSSTRPPPSPESYNSYMSLVGALDKQNPNSNG